MSGKMMKVTAVLGAAAALLGSAAVNAESTYGYSAAGTAQVSATARVTVTVAVPKLILLRVGADGATVDTLAFTAAFNGIPGGVNAAGLADGSSKASAWSGAAPTFSPTASQSLTAYAWTNSSGGGQLGISTTAVAGSTGLTPASIKVITTAGAGAMPAHPGDTTTNANFGTFTRNVVHQASWGYSVDAAALGGAAAGSYSQTSTYTATTL